MKDCKECEKFCPEECGGCSCHISAPCSHHENHVPDPDCDCKNQKPDDCEACRFTTPNLKPHDQVNRKKRWLCDLCAGTMAGVAAQYPSQFPDRIEEALFSVCYVGNKILAAIDDLKTKV